MASPAFKTSVRQCVAAALLLPCLLVPLAAASQIHQHHAEPVDRDWSAAFGIDLGSLTSTRSLIILGVAGAGAAWSWEETDESHGVMQDALDGSFLDVPMDIGNVYGSGWVVGGGSLSVLTVGQLTGSKRLTGFGGDLCRSYLYSGLVTGVIKHAINRQRPSGGPLSFPSGHTTSAFSSVPVIWRHLGWQAGVGAGLLATSTALGRMEENNHYLSDVIFGAAIGFVVGMAVTDQRSHSELAEHVVVSGRRVALAWTF